MIIQCDECTASEVVIAMVQYIAKATVQVNWHVYIWLPETSSGAV